MKINDEAIDYVFCNYKLNVTNIAEAVAKIGKEKYIKEKRLFIKRYKLKLVQEDIRIYKIYEEIKKGINYCTARDNQTFIEW